MNDDEKMVRSRLICELDPTQRPREKAMALGFDALTDAELMAIIFATGVKGKSVVELCEEILEQNGSHLSLVAKKSVEELVSEHKGIGKVKAITMLAALQLGLRASADADAMMGKKPVLSSQNAYEYMKRRFQWLNHEEFWVMYLNRGGHVVREEKISQGGTFATSVDLKLILKKGIQCLAASMILFHNHPSGTLKPSIDDDRLTQKIIKGAEVVDIRVNDHIIVTDTGFYSYADKGRL